MKAINSYNYSEILNGVKNGQVPNLYIIYSQTFADDANGETELKWDNEPYFAGATIEEATKVLEDVSSITSAGEFECVELSVRAISVNANTFDYMEEDDDVEYVIIDFANEHYEDAKCVDDSLTKVIKSEYESLKGAILVYWSWHTYVGYARTFYSFEVCNDPWITRLYCMPSDTVSSENIDVLVSPSEVKACKSASELRDLMEERMAAMKLWRNDYNVMEFLQESYDESSEYGYELPENDLFNEEE